MDDTKHESLKNVSLNFMKASWSTNVAIVFKTLVVTHDHLGIGSTFNTLCFPYSLQWIYMVGNSVQCNFYSPISYFVAAILAVTWRFLTGFFLFELFTMRLRSIFVCAVVEFLRLRNPQLL